MLKCNTQFHVIYVSKFYCLWVVRQIAKALLISFGWIFKGGIVRRNMTDVGCMIARAKQFLLGILRHEEQIAIIATELVDDWCNSKRYQKYIDSFLDTTLI